jgi:hypothetical protein
VPSRTASFGAPTPTTLHGTVVLHGLYVAASNGVGSTCETTGNLPPNKSGLKPIPSSFDDVRRGATVRLADLAGHWLGTATLGAGRAVKPAHPVDEYDVECDFPFTMRRVTTGSTTLAVVAGRHRATVPAGNLATLRVPIGAA